MLISTSASGSSPKGPEVESAICLDKINKVFMLTKGAPMSLKAAVLSFKRPKPTVLNALSDINITIHRGEAVAIIGRNGSGKSTLLRIIGRVYMPTEGTVCVYGRMSTMLDLGAGFHPELTGRENIFFNGAILGLEPADIRGKIDKIIEFSEITDYIDAPVRTYSAGMLMRLGFSIATETDPEILLIDEVLAVGDAAFQEKCYDRIAEFKNHGHTIVFVTHDLESARMVADRTIWVDKGIIRLDGPTNEVIDTYLAAQPIHHHAG